MNGRSYGPKKEMVHILIIGPKKRVGLSEAAAMASLSMVFGVGGWRLVYDIRAGLFSWRSDFIGEQASMHVSVAN